MFQEFEGAERDRVIALHDALVTACTDLPEAVRTAENMAKGCYAVLRTFAEAEGQNPASEVFLRAPGEPRHFPGDDSWCVVWEAGPYQWAIGASMAITVNARKLCEPYYSFDLCFYPGED